MRLQVIDINGKKTNNIELSDKIFSVKQIKLIEIIRILEKEPTIDRPVYSLNFRTE